MAIGTLLAQAAHLPLHLLAAIGLLVIGALLVLWQVAGPDAMARRKRARRELWLNVHAQQVQDQQELRKHERAIRAASRVKDHDKFEREVKRWD